MTSKFFRTLVFTRDVLLKSLLCFIAVIVLIVLIAVFRVVTYNDADDQQRVANKKEYLEHISGLVKNRSERPPNFVVILFDDLGYGDIGAYGNGLIKTPNIDRLAKRGLLFTNYYSPSAVCSPARASLLTGREPPRTNIPFALVPNEPRQQFTGKLFNFPLRLPGEEITIAEILQHAGYATALIGKWHLGTQSPSLPNDMGFDLFVGTLSSNDQPPVDIYRNSKIIEADPPDQSRLTQRYTEQANKFVEANQDKPFFLYLAHNFPHIPLYSSAEQSGKSAAGLYGDVVEDLDRSVGEVNATLERLGIAEQTLVIITSDNGPWYQGSSGVATRGRKLDTFEGGMRVPFIVSWPGRISSRVAVDQVIRGVDIMPTLLEIAELPPPGDRVIDGHSIKSLLIDNSAVPERNVYYYKFNELMAVRSGRYKYYGRQATFGGAPSGNMPFAPLFKRGPWLFDLETDPMESYDVSGLHTQTTQQLRKIFEARRAEIKNNPRGWLND